MSESLLDLLEADDDGWAASLNDASWCNCVFSSQSRERAVFVSEGENIEIMGGMLAWCEEVIVPWLRSSVSPESSHPGASLDGSESC